MSLIGRRSNGSYSRAISVLLLIPAAALAAMFIGTVTGGAVYPYPLSAAARASGAIVVVGPFVAFSAAFEMRVLRALWGRLDVRLPWYRVAAGRLWLVAGAGLLIMVASYVVAVGPSLLTTFPGWEYPLISIVGVLAWTSVGAALGLVFRPLVALPTAVITPYLALTLPGAWEPLWLRHLTGMLFDCCSTSEVVDHRAVAASVGILAACGLVAWLLVFLRLGPPRPSALPFAAFSTLAVGVVLLAVGQARQLGAFPTEIRATNELQCAGDVCLWPEDGRARKANELAWAEVRVAWAELGLPLIRTTIGPVSAPGMLGLVSLTEDPGLAAGSMSVALPRGESRCEDRFDDDRANLAAEQLSFLLLQRVGSLDVIDFGTAPDPLPAPSDAPDLWHLLGSCRP